MTAETTNAELLRRGILIEDLPDLLRRGELDNQLGEILLAIQRRQEERDRWGPIEEILSYVRLVDVAMKNGGGPQDKATLGAELNFKLKPYLKASDVLLRHLAQGVQADIFIRLFNVPADRADAIVNREPPPGNADTAAVDKLADEWNLHDDENGWPGADAVDFIAEVLRDAGRL